MAYYELLAILFWITFSSYDIKKLSKIWRIENNVVNLQGEYRGKFMTIERFRAIEEEVKLAVETTLDMIEENHFSNYVLLLAHADYVCDRYMYGSTINLIREENHMKFLLDYLNSYSAYLHEPISLNEYDYTIQMMIYCHLWESNYFFKFIKRIAYIAKGKTYKWDIRLDHTVARQNIINQSKELLLKKKCLIGNMIDKSYCADLRNAFAHMSYKFELKEQRVVLYADDCLAYMKVFSIEEWEEWFVYSLLLTFYLLNSIDYRKNTFMDKYPDKEKILVDVPAEQKGMYDKKYAYPRRKGEKLVEFYCIPQDV